MHSNSVMQMNSPQIKIPSQFEILRKDKFEFPELDIECLEIRDDKSQDTSNNSNDKVTINKFGIKEIKNLHLSKFKSKKIEHSSESIKSLGNITEEKTIDDSAPSKFSNNLSQNKQKAIKTKFEKKKNEKSEMKHFSISKKLPNKLNIANSCIQKKMKENRKNNNFSRQTFIPFQKLKPLKTEININSKITKHKEKLLQLTNPHKMEDISSSCSEDMSEDFQDNDQDDLMNLNFFINSQLNPHLKKKQKLDFNKNKFKSNIQNNPLHQIQFQLSHNISQILTKKTQNNNLNTKPINFHNINNLKFKDLVYICEKSIKYLKILQLEDNRLNFISKKSFEVYLSIDLKNIKRIIISEKDDFLLKITYNEFNTNHKCEIRNLIVEISSRRMFLNIFKKKKLEYLILPKRSLEIESDDLFKNCSFNLFPKCMKQGFLELYVDDMFNDWRTYFVCLVDKCLMLFDINRKQKYSNYKDIMKKINIYRIISYNVIDRPNKIGLNRRYMFAIKILNENSQLIFSTYNKGQRKQWLKCL